MCYHKYVKKRGFFLRGKRKEGAKPVTFQKPRKETLKMNIETLINCLENYPKDMEIKIIVDDKEEEIRCFIHNKDKGVVYLADSTYSS